MFSLTYIIVIIRYIIRITYKTDFNQPFMLLIRISVTSWLLIVKFWGIKIYKTASGGLVPLTLAFFKGWLYIEEREWFYSMRFPLLWIKYPFFQPSSSSIPWAVPSFSKHSPEVTTSILYAPKTTLPIFLTDFGDAITKLKKGTSNHSVQLGSSQLPLRCPPVDLHDAIQQAVANTHPP